MATGIKSTINTGSGTLQTPPGRSHGAAQAHGGSYFEKIKESWNRLNMKKKFIIAIMGVGLVLTFTGFNLYSRATGYIELYPQQKPTVQDTREITLRLAQMKIPYKEEEGGAGILVPPSMRSRAQFNLAGYGLPHRPVYTMENEGSGLNFIDQEKRKYMLNLQKQADIILALRSMEGIADANVQLVPAEDNAIENDSKPAKAAVMLELLPGARLSTEQVKGIVRFVSNSIGSLTPMNVTLVDRDGRILNDENLMAEENHTLSNNAVQKQTDVEKIKEQKAQSMLDKSLGPNKAWVRISVTMDFDESETVSERYGPPGHQEGSQAERETKEIETFFQNHVDPANVHQIALQGEDALKNMDYKKEKSAVLRHIDKVKETKVKREPSIQKITASVAVDSLSSVDIEKVRKTVAGAIGIDEARGDKIYVASFPFPVNLYQKLREDMLDRNGLPLKSEDGVNRSLFFFSLFAIALLMLIATIFFLKQRIVRVENSKPVLSMSPAETLSPLSDFLHDKRGAAVLAPDTRINTNERLEKLAREKAPKLAEMLKSTWLVEK